MPIFPALLYIDYLKAVKALIAVLVPDESSPATVRLRTDFW